ncbi:SGNH/GDSL hydrolase family protein [Streptomyces oryzae]|uniref:SGNH/GDSL hydrolase family protein n=1 Tax=Streptomyces oryzae TaxID=1434886 RepID=A0ABS3X8D1_9ACTN|nr:SGNH/GDSL hydrolase family protein [Streptomyces oryzae]MBO8191625.1 SGNH/GDSL hydrolase family protein [Streptomyces oryzae]
MTHIVCLGDSHTRAQVGADYIKMLRKRLGAAYSFTNAGVNGDLACNALQRLDSVIDARPDIVTVLIGTNDANASLSETNVQMMTKMKKLQVRPTIDGYEENLRALTERLVKETDARIALLSLPVLGQDPGTLPVRRAAEYSKVVERTAAEYGAAYLPLYERQLAHLESTGAKDGIPFQDGKKLSSRAAMQHFMLFRSFDAISRSRGLELTTDFIHQNTRGATMIADLIEDFVRD